VMVAAAVFLIKSRRFIIKFIFPCFSIENRGLSGFLQKFRA
jgi:hypothetical protein